jgi:hypothetical protein
LVLTDPTHPGFWWILVNFLAQYSWYSWYSCFFASDLFILVRYVTDLHSWGMAFLLWAVRSCCNIWNRMLGAQKTSSRHNMHNVGTCIQHFTQKSLICVDIYRNLMKLALPLFCRPNLASFRSTADVSVRACVKRIPCLSVKLKTICRPFVSICQGISAALSIYFLSNGFAHSIVVHHSTSHLDLSVWSWQLANTRTAPGGKALIENTGGAMVYGDFAQLRMHMWTMAKLQYAARVPQVQVEKWMDCL